MVWRCGVGAAADAVGENARKASIAATQEATHGEVPDLIFLSVAPGHEEDVLDGIRAVCGNVPVFGGSSADDSVVGAGNAGVWWQLHGSIAGWGTHANGVVVAALWLFADANVSCLLSHCYAPTKRRGTITKASGRVLSEIDHRPAAQVLNEWVGNALSGKSAGSSVMDVMALFPLAVVHCEELRLIHLRAVVEGGQVDCFSVVPRGEVKLLHLKTDLVGAVAAVARTALERVAFDVKGAIIDFCAGTTSVIEDVQVLVDALPKELPELFCFFSFGEQGMINGVSCHGNLMVNITLVG